MSRVKFSTKPERGTEAVIERIARASLYAIDEADLAGTKIRAAGVGVPGLVNPETGVVLISSLFQEREVPLREKLEARLGFPVIVENAAGVGTLGVHVVELKRAPRNMLCVSIGAEIGVGLIVNGELYRGNQNEPRELGHLALDANGPKCRYGHQGCWDALASRRAIVQRIRTAIQAGESTLLTELAGPDLAKIRSAHLHKALLRGDPLVGRVVPDAARYCGMGIAKLAKEFKPELVVLGGGVMEAGGKEMLGMITAAARGYAAPGVLEGVDIILSALGNYAGITGGALLARQMSK